MTVTVLDVNDESPTFTSSQYNVTLTEDTPVSSRPVLTVLAVDRDSGLAGHVTYSIASGDGTDKFHVDADSGALSVISPLDYETKTSYRYVNVGTSTSYRYVNIGTKTSYRYVYHGTMTSCMYVYYATITSYRYRYVNIATIQVCVYIHGTMTSCRYV